MSSTKQPAPPPRQPQNPQRLALTSLWASSDFVLAATHTHNGPAVVEELDPYIAYGLTDLTQITNYSGWLEDRVVGVVSRPTRGDLFDRRGVSAVTGRGSRTTERGRFGRLIEGVEDGRCIAR